MAEVLLVVRIAIAAPRGVIGVAQRARGRREHSRHTKYHRQSLGTLMLARLVVHLFNEHDALESFHDSDLANAFYRKRGWHVTSA